jgi:hypothetical protein
MCAVPAEAAALTLGEAQTLPTRELISKALGELGDEFIDVRRPTGWEGFAISIPRGAVPSLSSLTFYRRASLANASGLCKSDSFTLFYNKDGKVYNYMSITLFGVVNDKLDNPPSDGRAMILLQPEQELNCSSAVTTQNFFLAPFNGELAARAALAIKAIEAQHRQGVKFEVKVKCSPMAPCVGPDPIFGRLSLTAISNVLSVDCDTHRYLQFASPIPDKACLNITLNDNAFASDSLYVETILKDNKVFVPSISFSPNNMKIY